MHGSLKAHSCTPVTLSLFFNIIYRTFGAHLPALRASALQSPLTAPLQCYHKALSHANNQTLMANFFSGTPASGLQSEALAGGKGNEIRETDGNIA